MNGPPSRQVDTDANIMTLRGVNFNFGCRLHMYQGRKPATVRTGVMNGNLVVRYTVSSTFGTLILIERGQSSAGAALQTNCI